MAITLEVQAGPAAGRSIPLADGRRLQVGRSGWADLSIPDDPALADLHFALESGPTSCRLRDLYSPGGTFVNDVRVTSAELREGDRIRAGQTLFIVRGEALVAGPVPARAVASSSPVAPAPVAAPPAATPLDRLLGILRGQDQPLFALLDAARDPAVLAMLHRFEGTTHQSLYEGTQGEMLAPFAPYLVQLPAGSPLLEALAREAWGRSWGVYLCCDREFADVRKHFRHFLLVKNEDGKPLYFRFYDPRVLRVFLPTCRPHELDGFFGPVSRYLMEAEDPKSLVQFSRGSHGLSQLRESLDAPPGD